MNQRRNRIHSKKKKNYLSRGFRTHQTSLPRRRKKNFTIFGEKPLNHWVSLSGLRTRRNPGIRLHHKSRYDDGYIARNGKVSSLNVSQLEEWIMKQHRGNLSGALRRWTTVFRRSNRKARRPKGHRRTQSRGLKEEDWKGMIIQDPSEKPLRRLWEKGEKISIQVPGGKTRRRKISQIQEHRNFSPAINQ